MLILNENTHILITNILNATNMLVTSIHAHKCTSLMFIT